MFIFLFFIYVILIVNIIFIGIISYNMYKVRILCEGYVINKIKKDVVRTVSMGIEQLYSNLNGEEKMNKTIENINIIFNEKKIKVTDLELRMLIESSVKYINLKEV